jgi:phage terminase large subunit
VLSREERDELRILGQVNLGSWIMAARGLELWSKQQEILTELSIPRAKLVVPSTNASGKTFLAANAVIAFYDSFTPGTPCVQCDPEGTKGGCRGCKVLTTSSKEIHLKDNLWGEVRMALADLAQQGIEIPGVLAPADTLLIDSWGNHFIRGQVATKEEGFQGYHAAHKLIVGDEATSVGQDVARGITSLMATADTRLLLIFNPTTNDTYAATMSRSERVKVIPITAFDTPHFTGEHVPEGSNLTTPEFLEDLIAQGMGPGSYEWTTRIEAKFWDQGEDVLIPPGWVHGAKHRDPLIIGTVGMGIDLAPYGTAESSIGIRRGDNLVDIKAFPSQRVDHFINGDPESKELSPVRRMVRDYGPYVIVYDADGVGAGAIGEFTRLHEWAIKHRFMDPNSMIIPFRGGKRIDDHYTNSRSAWWWALRRRFERGRICLQISDPKTESQLSQLTYRHTNTGQIRVETKDEMRNRSLESPDRADAVMYTFAFSEELPDPDLTPATQFVVASGYVHDDTEAGMWSALDKRLTRPRDVNPVTGIPDELD